ncbi:hypothetical protein [Amycolatopsis taiwanensis]|uniref:hypothetical protein n=1 Tax=Amycolatopsis taiwanensis TaxID=342230 RepID=UPI00146FB21D|nr:hypothetical protein [Amycolatopsis taiwanensis]
MEFGQPAVGIAVLLEVPGQKRPCPGPRFGFRDDARRECQYRNVVWPPANRVVHSNLETPEVTAFRCRLEEVEGGRTPPIVQVPLFLAQIELLQIRIHEWLGPPFVKRALKAFRPAMALEPLRLGDSAREPDEID